MRKVDRMEWGWVFVHDRLWVGISWCKGNVYIGDD